MPPDEVSAIKAGVDDAETAGPGKSVVAHLGEASFTARPHARSRRGEAASFASDAVGISLFDLATGAALRAIEYLAHRALAPCHATKSPTKGKAIIAFFCCAGR
jgi:hypothetical protein